MIFKVGNEDDDQTSHDSRNKDGPCQRLNIRSVLKNHNEDDARDKLDQRILRVQFFMTTSRLPFQNKKRKNRH